ncbi:MAG TPA: YSC84-related protein [Steroidobacteraceae bacterium]|jgi:lipid-binding SYLF domain-containing protein|nr:YSC84-related protein [Steroidobacteraceae bacterium]
MNKLVKMMAVVIAAVTCSTAIAAVKDSDLQPRVQATLENFYSQNPSHRELVDKAAAVLVFPEITKAGAGIAGEGGRGMLLINGSEVGRYTIKGASVGATLGVAGRSEIILFMTREARDKFEQSKGWTIGADLGVAVASKGAGGQYDTETLKRPIIAFVINEHGLMGDVSLKGEKITRVGL